MKLRTEILALGLSGALLAGMVGSIGLASATRLGDDAESAIEASHALKASQVADMMHDAIRGDSQLALLGALSADAARIEEAARDLKDHAATLQEELGRLEKMSLSADSQASLAQALPLARQYIDAAGRAVAAAKVNKDAATASVADFQKAFSELEASMAKLSDSIEKTGDEQAAQTQSSIGQAKWIVALALLLATVTMTAVALWMARHIASPMAQAVDTAERLAQGNLTVQIAARGNDETRKLLDALERMRDGLVEIVRNVKANADSVASASQQFTSGNQDLSNRTSEQAAALQQTAASMHQLGSTVAQNVEHAAQANELALSASDIAVQGGSVVSQVVSTMHDISESSRKISDIIGVIDGIAFQTNILALNAAVEAARAGDQGRGFAVVASEVRTLAGRSAAAAKEIKTLIQASVDRVEQGRAQVGQAGATMQEIVESIKRVTLIMGDINTASVQQRNGVEQVGCAISEMDQATQQNAALVEESAAASQNLHAKASELVSAVAAFQLADAR